MRPLRLQLCALLLCAAALPAEGGTRVCVRLAPTAGGDFTVPLQSAIDACAARGGGRVVLGPGRYEIGPIRLASRIDLHLERDALLQGTTDKSRYQAAFINWAFRPGEALISAADVHDISITGEGTIDGGGAPWWQEARTMRWTADPKVKTTGIPVSNGQPRPWLIEAWRAEDVTISGVRIRNAPMWNIVLRYAKSVRIEGVDIENPADAPNTDGVDVVASRDVAIEDCAISTGDDNIAIKSGLAGSALPAELTEKVRIRNMRFGRGHGLSIGSETLFGIRDVVAENLEFSGTGNGIRIKSGRDRGSRMGNFRFENITMRDVGTAISISDYYPRLAGEDDPAQPHTATTPQIADVTIRNLKAEGSINAGLIVGLPEAPLQSIRLEKIRISAREPLRIRNALVSVQNVTVEGPPAPLVTERGAKIETE